MATVLAAAILLGSLFAAWHLLPIDDWMQVLVRQVERLGFWGFIGFGLVYVLATVLLAPGSVLSIAAGLAFGIWGIPLVLVAATADASAAFLLGRYAARARVQALLEVRPRFAAIDKAVEEAGWKVVLLLRLSPVVPFNLQNYFFGITRVSFRDYVLATFVGIAPGAVVFVWLGMIGRAAATGTQQTGPVQWALFGFGLVATVAAVVLIGRRTRARLNEMGIAEGS